MSDRTRSGHMPFHRMYADASKEFDRSLSDELPHSDVIKRALNSRAASLVKCAFYDTTKSNKFGGVSRTSNKAAVFGHHLHI